MQTPLVSPKWLHENMANPQVIILDASLKNKKSDLAPDNEGRQIPGARYFDLKNDFSDPASWLPNTMPTATAFTVECRKLGVNKDSKIVVYDQQGIYSSPRVWWMFKVMGHREVAVLNGGLPAWSETGFDLEPIQPGVYEPGNFEALFHAELLTNTKELIAKQMSQEVAVIDARSSGRFNGTSPEPRKGLESGHIPGSYNLPYIEVLTKGYMKSKEEIQQIFERLELAKQPMVFTCGSGLTACIIILAAELVSEEPKILYDGSWTEWAQTENLPIGKDFS